MTKPSLFLFRTTRLLATVFVLGSICAAAVPGSSPGTAQSTDAYSALVIKDGAAAYWRFSEPQSATVKNEMNPADEPTQAKRHAESASGVEGPGGKEFQLFAAPNPAIEFRSAGQYFRLTDPGAESVFDFDQGQAITLEAWVKPEAIPTGGYAYLIGKGRTQPNSSNQNFALRLTSAKAGVGISFLFRSRGDNGAWHRWTSKDGMTVGDGWHHVAVTYTFGQPKNLKGYIDGVAVKGDWDMGGASANAPVVDDDDAWIGSAMGGSPGNSYRGGLDELAVYRTALSSEQIQKHYQYTPPKFQLDTSKLPADGVIVDLYEDLPDRKTWAFRPPRYVESYQAPGFGFIELPKKYSEKAVQIDRSNPCLLRASGRIVIPAGEQRLLIRSRNSARLYLDDELIAETSFHDLGGDNGPVFPIDRSLAPNIHPLHRGDKEKVVTIEGDGQPHVIVFETIIGGSGRRPELGETGAYIARPNEDFRLLGSTREFLLTDAGWEEFVTAQQQFLDEFDLQRRTIAGVLEGEYWKKRHAWAKQVIDGQAATAIPQVSGQWSGKNWIDNFIGHKLEAAGMQPAPLTDDASFLRRVTLDITGRMPTRAEIERFQNDPADARRSLAIDRLLTSREWADHWVGYWQDVLAENPNIINPTLNNTGPFRYWIEESFRDNKPFDRFVTELVMMEGSTYFGGPGGFQMASENDAPLAAKSHIIAEAFLGVEMKCARCHDAPFHDIAQRDLFALSAMLNRDKVKLPVTSTVPGGSNSLLIEITLFPGDTIEPVWPFTELSDEAKLTEMLRDPKDSREKLALLLTSPYNNRFAPVIVNRLWQRYLGYGFVEPVDDWEHANPSHPELLEALSRELVANNYDLKHLARLIFNSAAYQRESTSRDAAQPDAAYLFAAPLKRRLSAEQLVDSLFLVSGKPFDADVMCIDIDTSRELKQSLNLGTPRRAWQFASLSNERDRPSLSLPFAQPFITTLETFGWRSSRQDPITVRETAPNPLQPAEVSNGLLARRACTLSDDSAFTVLAMQDQSVEQLIDNVYRQVLTRTPSATERQLFVELLTPGYETRRIPGAVPKPRERLPRNQVAWTNHLDPEASNIKLRLEDEVRQGDPPTVLLNADWRERLEDAVWTLVNSPEFMFVP
ncbi:DUF1553 domain-containing protein [Planctomicrobium piriforme]|uniref:Concanavalin A-like lectin/glucanases superfamily protein n=1 Tax=Planctomicrobium piriforme TaxID=1576369 RepID=A0A1I3J5W2_9PLAN|nr:DUF1553 domain-containing protein [Planctomicrobium piriforme]SFI55573.1 Concanavalin A-like lectin/glucanases superfamily protein [Planctomicrobium piriforme]